MVRREEGRYAGRRCRRPAGARAGASASSPAREEWAGRGRPALGGRALLGGTFGADCRTPQPGCGGPGRAAGAGRDAHPAPGPRLRAARHARSSSSRAGRGTYGELPVQMFEEIGDLYNQGRFSVNVAIGHYYEGDWDRAVAMYRRSLDLAERTGDVFSVAVAQMNIGEVLAHQGKVAEAVDILTAERRRAGGAEHRLAAAHAACFLGSRTGWGTSTRKRARPGPGGRAVRPGGVQEGVRPRRARRPASWRSRWRAAISRPHEDAERLLTRGERWPLPPRPCAPLRRARPAGPRRPDGARADVDECLPVARSNRSATRPRCRCWCSPSWTPRRPTRGPRPWRCSVRWT